MKTVDYSGMTYSLDVDKVPSVELSFVDDWNLILCAYSKNQEIALLEKQPNSDVYEFLEIEDYKCLVPLSKSDEDLCPLGMAVNFTSQSSVKLEKLDMQPPSPMVFLLSDNGVLTTYYAINLASAGKSICVPAAKMAFKNIAPAQLPRELISYLVF